MTLLEQIRWGWVLVGGLAGGWYASRAASTAGGSGTDTAV